LKQEKKVLKVFQNQINSLNFKKVNSQTNLRHSQDMIVERFYETS